MLDAAVLRQFQTIVGERYVHHTPEDLIAYSYDGTWQAALPDAAVSPASTDEVAAVVRVCDQHGLAIVPRGGASGLAGGTVPVGGGVVVSTTRLDRILEIDRANMTATVQAGVITADLQRAVEAVGLFYPPDPSSLNQSSIGGNVATNAGGPRCLKYGVTRDYVLGLTAVLADGRVLVTGGKAIKNVTGYQLTQLFIGSEGHFGIITEVLVRLLPKAVGRSTGMAIFPTLEAASAAVTTILTSGLLPLTLELMDNTTITVVEDFLQLGLPRAAEALLIFEQDGDPAVAAREVAAMGEICTAAGALSVQVAATPEEGAQLLKARRSVSGAMGRISPNKLGEDIAVPRSAIPAMVRRVREIAAETGLIIPVFGHAGDGNLHPNILFDRRDPDQVRRVEQAAAAIFRSALELGGTLSGEHGIGTLKREFLEEDLGPVAVDLMRRIKQALDPKGLLNPHKVFPERPGPDKAGFLTALPTL
jgi:glycolate oxidase